MIADYFIVRGCSLEVDDLYRRGGEYEYRNGVNPRALVSLALGVVVALLGLVIPPLRWLYDYAWFVGFAVSAGSYVALMRPGTKAVLHPQPARGGELGD
jgi:NCS1 family nucleobase:cation symporter-1